MKVDVKAIGNLGHAYLPHVYDEVSLSAPLKGHQIQLFKSLPVAEVLKATEERSLKELYCFISSIFVGLQIGQQYSNLLRTRLLYNCIIAVLLRSLNILSTHAVVL